MDILEDPKVAAQERINRSLIPFSGGLPYSAERYQQEIHMLYAMHGIMRYEIGRRLIVMWEQEKGVVRTFGQFLEQFFPDLPRQRAYEDMNYAAYAEKSPLFRQFAEGKGNWSKALVLMEAVDKEAMEEFEKTGKILGMKLDELDKLSVRDMKKRIRKLEEGQTAAVAAATHKLLTDNEALADKVMALEAQLAEAATPVDKALGLIKAAEKRLFEAFPLLGKVSMEVVAQDKVTYDFLIGVLALSERVIGNLLAEVSVAGRMHTAEAEEEGEGT